LLGGIGPASFSARGCPVIRGRLASRKRSEKPQLHRLAFRAEITASEQKGLARLRAEVGKRERGGQRFRFACFHSFPCFLPRVPFGAFFIGEERLEILVLNFQFLGKPLRQVLGFLRVGIVFQKRFLVVADLQRIYFRVPRRRLVRLLRFL